MKILIRSTNANTYLPLVNELPDYTGVSEPTLSILRAAYDAGNYEIVPDPETEESPIIPNWTAFNFQLFNNPAFVAYGLAANSANPFLLPALVERYGLVAKDGVIESGFAAYWNAFCVALSIPANHRNQWADLAVSFNIPQDFISVIRG